MFNSPEKVIRWACVLLGAVVLFEISRLVSHSLPLRKLEVPGVPSLAMASTNSGSDLKKGTNGLATTTNSTAKSGTNLVTNSASSNKIVSAGKAPGNTNIIASSDTNTASSPQTNASATASNSVVSVVTTNKITKANQTTTNSIVAGKTDTNSSASSMKGGRPVGGMPGMPGGALAGSGGPRPELPPAIKARIERITQSEILGMVIHPMPMALLGIAGDEAFIRSPEGQTGAIKEGAKLGSLKLLQIGTNRVLIEQDGQKKELMIFAGLGGDSLMPKEKTKTNEIKKPSP
jgi:hypothetical protein